MKQERYKRTSTITIEECERCKESHEYPVEIIFDRIVDVMGMMMITTETYDIVLTCPNTGEDIVVSIPVTLTSLETLVRVQPKG